MFDRFILASNYQRIRQKFDMASLPEGEDFVKKYNIAPDDSAYVVKSELSVHPETLPVLPTMQNFLIDKVPTKAIRSFKFGLMGVEKTNKYFL